MKNRMIMAAGAALVCVAAVGARAADGPGAATLYDTGAPVKIGDTAASLGEGSWKALGKDAAGQTFRGDAALMNGKLAAIARKDGSGVDLYAKGANGWNHRGRLAPVTGGARAKLAGLKVAVVEEAGLGIDASVKGAEGAGLVFTMDQPGFPAVKATPRGKVQALRFLAPCRLGILPDFWTDDLMVDARAIPIDRMEIPAGNIFLHPVGEGNALVAAVWEKSERDIEVALAGAGNQRTITSMDVFIEGGGSVWAAALEQKGIWHQTPFKLKEMNTKGKGKKLDWVVPFIAKWKGNITLADGTVLSRQFKYRPSWHDGGVDALVKDGAGLAAVLKGKWKDVLHGSSITNWKRMPKTGGGQDSSFGEHSVLAVYPISRDKETPLDRHCIDDLLRLLGTEICAYVLDLDARHGESKPGIERGIFTCADSVIMQNIMPIAFPRNDRALAQFMKDERVYRRLIDSEVLYFLTLVQDRINSYVAFRKDLLARLDEQEKKRPDLADFIGRLRTQLTKPTPLYSKSVDSMTLADGAAQAAPLLAKRALPIEIDTPENAAKCVISLRHIGDPQDGRVAAERLKVARLRVMATIEMAVNPAAADLAREVRKGVQDILRNPTTWEKPRKW